MRKFLKLLLITVVVSGCSVNSTYTANDTYKDIKVRLLIYSDDNALSVSVNGFSVYDPQSMSELQGITSLSSISVAGDKVRIGDKSFKEVLIVPDNGRITINSMAYRGSLYLYAENSKLNAVNEIPLEEYLYGVVSREMSASSPMEALKAQAVAARTFVRYEMSVSKNKRYHISDLQQTIAYSTASKEHSEGIKAVDATRGVVMKYNGNIAFTPFHANCGGYTENVKEVWGTALPYLTATPCHFCENRPHYTWKTEIDKSHMIKTLNAKGYNAGDIIDIDARYEVTKSGRAQRIKITTDKGKIIIDINIFRLIVGSDTLKSSRSLTARPRGASFVFTGKGWGHGVGMCQDGADKMGTIGYNYKNILRRYYSSQIEITDK